MRKQKNGERNTGGRPKLAHDVPVNKDLGASPIDSIARRSAISPASGPRAASTVEQFVEAVEAFPNHSMWDVAGILFFPASGAERRGLVFKAFLVAVTRYPAVVPHANRPHYNAVGFAARGNERVAFSAANPSTAAVEVTGHIGARARATQVPTAGRDALVALLAGGRRPGFM
jgi:hypothetical protein